MSSPKDHVEDNMTIIVAILDAQTFYEVIDETEEST